METFYLGIVIFLFLLAIFDLVVGVSNDAVNFLNSAIGAKAAPFKAIMCIAAIRNFAGASLSNGMTDIARHGLYPPEHFYRDYVYSHCCHAYRCRTSRHVQFIGNADIDYSLFGI